jgi:polysaccharide biosynthesis protein PslJ
MRAALQADRVARLSACATAASLALLAYAVVAHSNGLGVAILAVLATTILICYKPLLEWHVLLGVLIAVIMFVPIKRYLLPGGLPVDFEPYRALVALIIVGWLAALLADPATRARGGALGVPLAVVLLVATGSIAVNGARVLELGVSLEVVKALSFLLSFALVYYLIVSVIQSQEKVDLMLKLLVAGGAVVSLASIVESRTGFNVFDHWADVVPALIFEQDAVASDEEMRRAGTLRVYGSSQHPIALAAALAMIVPLGLYLALTTRRRLWWAATVLVGLGALATVSRTGVIMLVVFGLVFLWLRPLQTRRMAPLLVPALVVVYIAVPGALGSLYGGFFGGGLTGALNEQQISVQHAELSSDGRVADIGPTLQEAGEQPLLGQGYGTRVAGVNARLLDNQWLLTLVETGLLGVAAWFWVFRRAIRRLARAAKEDASPRGLLCVALAASIFSFAVGMLTYDAFSFVQVTFILIILLGLSAVVLALPSGASD